MPHHPEDQDDEFATEADTTVFTVKARPRGPGKARHLLVCTEGAQIGRVERLTEQPLTVGRTSESGMQLDVKGVSRKHALIRAFGRSYVLEDQGSSNGTFVDGERVEQRILQDGDVIAFGPSASFRYSIADEEQERMLRALFDATQTDTLTGVGNRHAFDQQLAREVSYAKSHGTTVSLLLVDIDHFKAVNDTHGHAVGDEVLREVAQRLGEAVRGVDTLCRYGGEEFGVVLRNATPGQVKIIAERLRTAVAGERFTERKLTLTVSVGGASFDPTRDKSLLEQADERLYEAKAAGRNRVIC